jgi:hypothetical protein
MPRFAVYFDDEGGAGIQLVMAMDEGHAKDIMRATHPEGRMSVLAAALIEGQDRHALLARWLRRKQ